MIVDEDREVSASTQWAQDFAHEIAQGSIVKIQLSNRMQAHFQELMERETELLERQEEGAEGGSSKGPVRLPLDGSCGDIMRMLSRGVLEIITAALLGAHEAKPLTGLVEQDDLSTMSLHPPPYSHSDLDSGLLTLLYAPPNLSSASPVLMDGAVSLSPDEVAVWTGCALQRAAEPFPGTGLLTASRHSVAPHRSSSSSRSSATPLLVYNLRGCSGSSLGADFLSPHVLGMLARRHLASAPTLGQFYDDLEGRSGVGTSTDYWSSAGAGEGGYGTAAARDSDSDGTAGAGAGDGVSKHYCHKGDEVWAVDRGMLYEGRVERVEEYQYSEQYYVHFKHFKRCQDRWVDEEFVAKKGDEEKIESLEEQGMERVVMAPRKKK